MFEKGQINLGHILGTTIAIVLAAAVVSWVHGKREQKEQSTSTTPSTPAAS
jgi:FlaG/FlaF family flagellin (archaellin)